MHGCTRTRRTALRTAILIIGLFLPLVTQAQPFGDTKLSVFDTEFLQAPPGPGPQNPEEPPLPDWAAPAYEAEPLALTPPPILLPELPS